MAKIILTVLTYLITISIFGQKSIEGVYVGLVKKSHLIDPSKPNFKSYNLSYLKIKGDSVYLDQSPVSIYRKDTIFSASDGGFYYYSGTIKKGSFLIIALTELSCDYCGVQVTTLSDGTKHMKKRKLNWKGVIGKDMIRINGYPFKKIGERELDSEHKHL